MNAGEYEAFSEEWRLKPGVGEINRVSLEGRSNPRLDLLPLNLVDHAMLRLSWNAVPNPVDEFAQCFQVLMRYTAPGSRVSNDMQIIPGQVPAQSMLKLSAALMKPLSRGTLRLHSADANEQPDIRLALAADPEDARRLRAAVRLLAALVQTPQLVALGSENIVFDNGDAVRASELVALAERDEWTDAFVQRFVGHYVHPVAPPAWGRHATLTPSWTSMGACTVSPGSGLLMPRLCTPSRAPTPT